MNIKIISAYKTANNAMLDFWVVHRAVLLVDIIMTMKAVCSFKTLVSTYKLRSLVAGLSPRRPGFAPGQSIWDLWWKKWHWDRFFSEFFGFTLSISFHRRCPNSYHLGNA
jgi:hypothetical protein